MNKPLRTSPVLRALALILALITLAGGFWATIFTLGQWDDIWTGGNYYSSSGYYHRLYERTAQVEHLVRLMQNRQWDGGKLSYTDQQQLELFQQALSAERTNFRFRVLDNETGELVYTNLTGDTSKRALEREVPQIHYTSTELERSSGTQGGDYFTWDGMRDWYQVHIMLPDFTSVICTPEDTGTAARYGWLLVDGGEWRYVPEQDGRRLCRELALEYGVLDPLDVHDEFLEGWHEYSKYAQYLPHIALATLAADLCCLLLTVFLCLGAGRRRDRQGVVLRPFDHIPLEIVGVLEFFAWAILLGAGDSMTYAVSNGIIAPDTAAGLVVVSLAGAGLALLAVLTVSVRIKAGTILTNTLTCLIGRAIARGVRNAAGTWPLTGRVVGLFLLYLLGTLLTGLTLFLIPVYQGLVLWALCRWTIQWNKVRAGAGRIVGGDPDARIDTRKMYRDLAEHAGQLNDLGSAVSTAVEERLQSERFKTELITNVSHDLKTPLTSIINYVDLLKKEDIRNEKAAEYLEVLDRKSQRLKKLTEDLVEASKASTGALTVHPERIGVVQLVQQALGEFEEKFSQHRLEPVLTVQDGEIYVMADGRHLWRVIDNLLSNCNKYALEGTRIYADVIRQGGQVALTVKNVSKTALNIPAEQLMERFVRGDQSRTTEGSGLGLSIARSLTELQGGVFLLEVDGDLFKAIVRFPEAPAASDPPALGLDLLK